MTTLRGMVDETRRHLDSGQRVPMNRLAGAISDTASTITFEFTSEQVQAGAYLEVDLEMMYVWTVDSQSSSAQVARGQMGSVAAEHLEGAIVRVNPRYPDFAIVKALNDDLSDLSAPVNGLFAVRALELTGSAASNGYDLTGASNVMEILSVSASQPGTRAWAPVSNYDLLQNAETDDFASGYALHLGEGVHSGRQLRVLYKAGFAALSALDDDVETVSGLPASAHDIPPLGAAARLVAPREIARNDTSSQGDSRRAGEVPPGAVASSARMLLDARQRRITAEAGKLAQRFPDRGFMPAGLVGW